MLSYHKYIKGRNISYKILETSTGMLLKFGWRTNEVQVLQPERFGVEVVIL